MKQEKTNVMRLLDREKIGYLIHSYTPGQSLDSEDFAKYLEVEPERIYKTLVTVGRSGNHYVFVIPLIHELDLKKAAAASGEKSIEMVKSRELLALTGYVHGGCSPIGMKKTFKTFVDASARNYERMCFSSGKVGFQVEIKPDELSALTPFDYVDLTADN